MPPVTMFVLLAMASLVAGVTEEAGFRGYMQAPRGPVSFAGTPSGHGR